MSTLSRIRSVSALGALSFVAFAACVAEAPASPEEEKVGEAEQAVCPAGTEECGLACCDSSIYYCDHSTNWCINFNDCPPKPCKSVSVGPSGCVYTSLCSSDEVCQQGQCIPHCLIDPRYPC